MVGVGRWFLKLGLKFIRGLPFLTIAVVLAGFVSQVSLLIAFLLPIKIVILLGSEGSPKFLPGFMESFEKEELIIGLSLLAIVFYVIKILSSKFSDWAVGEGADRLLVKTNKIVLFENQNEIACKAYMKYSEALACIFFSVIALAIVAFLYVDIFYVIVGSLLGLVSAFHILDKFNLIESEAIDRNFPAYVNTSSDIILLAIFSYIVIDFLYLDPPQLLFALISFILCRQTLSRTSLAMKNINFLRKQKDKINALFFHGHVFIDSEEVDKKTVWTLLEEEKKDTWVPYLLRECGINPEHEYEVKWIQAGSGNVLLVEISILGGQEKYLVKFFEKRNKKNALHEADLLASETKELPCAPLLLTTIYNGFNCIVIDITGTREMGPDCNLSEMQQAIREKLASIIPDKELTERYIRSKRMLWDRVSNRVFERLLLVASKEEANVINRYKFHILEIKHCLKNLPLVLSVPMQGALIRLNDHNEPVILDWGRWTLEPVGAGWPSASLVKYRFEKFVGEGIEPGDDLDIGLKSYEVSMIMSNMEAAFNRKRYRDAINILCDGLPQ